MRQMGDDGRAGIAAILLGLEPGDRLRIAVLLRRLTDDIRVKQPAHGFRRFAAIRRR
jgi:hypothetical protein